MAMLPYLNEIHEYYFDHFRTSYQEHARKAIIHILRALVCRVITELPVDTPPPHGELRTKLEEAIREGSEMHRRDPSDEELWGQLLQARYYLITGWADPNKF